MYAAAFASLAPRDRMISSSRSTLYRFLSLYAALYAGFGVQSPYLPILLDTRHLSPETIALALAAGTAMRLTAAPAVARRRGSHRVWRHDQVEIPLRLAARVRLGRLCRRLGVVRPGHRAFWHRRHRLAKRGIAACRVTRGARGSATIGERWPQSGHSKRSSRGLGVVAAAALSQDGFARRHAMHDSFAMIRWSRAGISPGTSGILWSLSVAAEVVVFVVVGRPLLDRIGPTGAAMLSAGAGVVRWAVMAETAWLPALALIEPLHGLTFALLHLTCMRLLAQCVPRHLEATALTIYGTVGIGVATALLTLACGPIFERFGAHGFWAMAALCAAALPLARTLREPTDDPG